MSTTGVRLKIDVTKIDKSKLYVGEKGTYLNCTVFLKSEDDEYGQNGMITQDAPKGEQGAILGNANIFWRDQEIGKLPETVLKEESLSDDIPF